MIRFLLALLLFSGSASAVTRTHADLINLVGRKGEITHLYDLYKRADCTTPSEYGTLAAAVTAIGAASRTLCISDTLTLTGSVSIPRNIGVIIYPGGYLTGAAAYTVAFNGGFSAGLYPVFDTTLSISLNAAEAFPQWWGAAADDATDCAPGIQRAITAAKVVTLPAGNVYRVGSTITIADKNGFTLRGGGMRQTNLAWHGAAGGTLMRLRGSAFTKIEDLWLNGNSLADTCLAMPRYDTARGDDYVSTMNTLSQLSIGSTRAAASAVALAIGDTVPNATQLDNLTVRKCWFENAYRHATIKGNVTFQINFTENCIFSAPTLVGVDISDQAGLVNFIGAQFIGTGPSVAYVRRSRDAKALNFFQCEMESNGPFFVGLDDAGSANTWPVTLDGCTIGFTGAAGDSIIDYRQRGPFLMRGGSVNSSNAAFIHFAAPGSLGATGGIVEDNGVLFSNVSFLTATASQVRRFLPTGEAVFPYTAQNLFGIGATGQAGVNLTLANGTADSTLYRSLSLKQGGGSASAQFCSQTATAITTARAIAEVELPAMVLVHGTDGTNSFLDMLLTKNTGTPTVVSSATMDGAPAARTYSTASFKLQLAMAAGTYRTNTTWVQMSAR